MPGLLHEGGLTMAIHKKVKKKDGSVKAVPMPDFSYSPNDSLAQMVVDAWVDKGYRDSLLERGADGITVTPAAAREAKVSLAARGYYLERAVVITEDEYDNDYTRQADNEVVFVLPNLDRVTPRPGQTLLETAKLLMAATPNGI
jgi:hypothetical protein